MFSGQPHVERLTSRSRHEGDQQVALRIYLAAAKNDDDNLMQRLVGFALTAEFYSRPLDHLAPYTPIGYRVAVRTVGIGTSWP